MSHTNHMKIGVALLTRAFNYVASTTYKHRIDESHGIGHSLDVLKYAMEIYNSELPAHPELQSQLPVIQLSAVLHDMCDKKYMQEDMGLLDMKYFMKPYVPMNQLNAACDIISTMSYSKVKRVGFPQLGDYQLAYHIVRESDLLAAYDIKRSIIYNVVHEKEEYDVAIQTAIDLMGTRVLRYIPDGLFVTEYGKRRAKELHAQLLIDVASYK